MRSERTRTPIRDMKREHASHGSGPVNSYKMSPEELEDYLARNAYTAPTNSNGIKEKRGIDLQTKPKDTSKPNVVAVFEKKESADVAHKVKEGPDKDFVLNRIASGKSISAVERELGMKANGLHYWLRKWEWVGITPGKARAILGGEPIEEVIKLDQEKALDNTPAAPFNVLELENQIAKYKCEIGRLLTLEHENKTRVTELTEDRDQWRQLCLEARQAVTELQEERGMLLATIEGEVTQWVDNGRDPDAVNHPSHYTAGGIETIDFIVAKLSLEEFGGFCKGNVLKYVARANHKGGLEDLQKARWYVDRLIDEVGTK